MIHAQFGAARQRGSVVVDVTGKAKPVDVAGQIKILQAMSMALVKGLTEDLTKSADWEAYPWASRLNNALNVEIGRLHLGDQLPGQNGNNDGMGEWV